jgi:hypothetical protein
VENELNLCESLSWRLPHLFFICGRWLELKFIYQPVWLGFLWTLVASVVSMQMPRTSKKVIKPSYSISITEMAEEIMGRMLVGHASLKQIVGRDFSS